MRELVQEARAIRRALQPYITSGMRLQKVGYKTDKPVVVLVSKKKYGGREFTYEAPVKVEEVEKRPRYVARLLSEDAARVMRDSLTANELGRAS